MTDLRVDLAGVELKNPIVVPSGTFGFGREYGQFFDLSELGAICVKGLTPLRREGNPAPRIAETPWASSTPWGSRTQAWTPSSLRSSPSSKSTT